jgi:hypothetical protein
MLVLPLVPPPQNNYLIGKKAPRFRDYLFFTFRKNITATENVSFYKNYKKLFALGHKSKKVSERFLCKYFHYSLFFLQNIPNALKVCQGIEANGRKGKYE